MAQFVVPSNLKDLISMKNQDEHDLRNKNRKRKRSENNGNVPGVNCKRLVSKVWNEGEGIEVVPYILLMGC